MKVPSASLLEPATISKSALAVPVFLAVVLLCSGTQPSFPRKSYKPHIVEAYGTLPLAFEPNEGQAGSEADFVSRGPGYSLLLSAGEAVLALHSSTGARPLKMRLLGANTAAKARAEEQLLGKSNYYIGNDPSKWRTKIPNYGKVRYKQVWRGLDVVYYGNQGQLEFDFVVSPGADPHQIRLLLSGAESLKLDAAGDLVVRAAGQEMRFRRPLVYQDTAHQRHEISARYAVRGNRQISFDLGSYDPSRPLVIDPILVYSTYLSGGGSGGDYGTAIAVDASGNVYATGYTTYVRGDEVKGPDPYYNLDVFVSKLTADGSALIYATHFGGNDSGERGLGIAVDAAGNAYVTGHTWSTKFPTLNAIQSTLRGSGDAFVVKLDPDGSLVFSTYLGGTGDDSGYGIAADSAGNAYVTGWTSSSDFPTWNALQATYARGYQTAFVVKLNRAGSALAYSTYLGGSKGANAYGIAVDAAGNAYLAGFTNSVDFPTADPLQAHLADALGDAFVAKLNAAGSALVYSTYLGGTAKDGAYGIAVDSECNAYVTGYTYSTDFPTANALQRVFRGPGGTGGGDAFVAKLNASGAALVYSTYLGGGGSDAGGGIAVDSAGNAYVTGATNSSDFPSGNALQTANAGGYEAFVAKLDTVGSALVYSTYLGGSSDDSGVAVAVDSAGNAYIVGWTGSRDFPAVNPLAPAAPAGSYSAFVTRIGAFSPPDPVVVLSRTSLTFGSQVVGTTSPAQSVTIWNSGTTAVLNIFSIGIAGVNGSDFTLSNLCGSSLAVNASCPMTVIFTPTAAGTRTASISITDNGSNNPQTITLIGIAPTVVSSATSLTFGGQLVGTTSPAQTVAITNYGAEALSIAGISIVGTNSADFAVVFNNCGTSLAAGANCTIGVSFTPGAAGGVTASLMIADSAPGSPQTIRLTGTGLAPAVTLTATSLAFGNQAVGMTSATAQRVTLRNTGTAALVITDLSISGTNAADFSLNSAGTTCSYAASVATSASCVISVFFTPRDVGARSASLAITDNASGSPHRITLTGTGITPAPAVTLSATSLTFANQVVGSTSAPQTVTLKNTGTAVLKIAGIAIAGANSSDFAQSNACGTSLAAGASCSITVTFTPTAAGPRTAWIAITDDASSSPQTVNLTGTGILPMLASGGVVNGATFASNQPLTAGSIASIFGTNLASSTVFASTTPLPTTLGATSVTVTCGAGSFQAPLFFVSPFQINLQLPWELLGQPQAILTVTFSGVISNPITLPIAAIGPGIFSLNSQGGGPGAILISGSADLAQPAGSVPGRTSRPASRSGIVSIFCTGLGALTTTPPPDGTVTPSGTLFNIAAPVAVSIGGGPVIPSFAGLAPGFVGLYQVNAQVPTGMTPGNAVPVFLIVGGVTSNTVTIAVQ